MEHQKVLFFCLQMLLLKGALALPTVVSSPSYLSGSLSTPVTTNVVPTNVLTGTGAQLVAPSYNPNWPANAQSVPLVTEIAPSLEFGEINVDGDMLVGGMIKISGTFPVFGTIGVDGSVPSYGTAYVDTGNVFNNDCACFSL